MNNELQKYARKTLKDNLQKCTEDEQLMFKRMYAGEDLEKDINVVVDDMESEKLDWAMQQVQRSLDKK